MKIQNQIITYLKNFLLMIVYMLNCFFLQLKTKKNLLYQTLKFKNFYSLILRHLSKYFFIEYYKFLKTSEIFLLDC